MVTAKKVLDCSLEGGDSKVVAVITRTAVYLLQGDASRSQHFSQIYLFSQIVKIVIYDATLKVVPGMKYDPSPVKCVVTMSI